MDACEPFRNKKITMLGLGVLGRGVGDAAFLAGCGADIIISDKKSAEELAPSVEQLKAFTNITYRFQDQPTEDFENRDLVIKAAGVPTDSPQIAAARTAGVPVVMSTALFARYAMAAGATLIGVTGTRGKSTVTQMIYDALAHTSKRVHLGGNVRGISTLALLPHIQEGDIVVLELDSWQLQGFGDLSISPQVAVFTNLMPDHMNYYGGDMESYFEDKSNIFRNQKTGDRLLVSATIEQRIRQTNPPVTPVVPEPLPAHWKLVVPGEHNRENAALAYAAVAPYMSAEEAMVALTSFAGVEGRLQFVRDRGGVKIYNDNNATTPEATVAALKALDTGKRSIILIAGGSDKALDMSALSEEIERTCKKLVLIDGTGTNRIQSLDAVGPFPTLEAAFKEALDGAEAGDIILFSPAFASFGMFKNEYERNDRFLKLVEAL
ncbi:hypothetical protein K8R03_03680 [Candidatus Kaiserbacteria bacterium]|nr:hypothetical protein [Candidatus Kaiserbacteria bacterium]